MAALALILVLGGAGVLGAGWWLTCGFDGCPDPDGLRAYQPGGAPVLLDRHGHEFAQLHPLERQVVSLDSVPAHLPSAFLAVEDRRFYQHRGVDWLRVGGAAVRNLTARQVREGASTLSMQLARTLFPERLPGRERSLRRKLLEVRVAGLIEARFDKEEILELYLNHVYVGGGAYGVEAGARHYFDRPAGELSLAEAAFLAGVVRGPAYYDPRRSPDSARERRDLVLSLMEAQGMLEEDEVRAARTGLVEVVAEPPRAPSSGEAPFFVEMVRQFMDEAFGEELYRSRLRIHTTLDRELQLAAEEELSRQLEAVEEGRLGWFDGPTFPSSTTGEGGRRGTAHLEGAVVLLDPGSGDLLALVGGRDFGTSRYNRGTRARREMGSAFKPFVYAAALSHGWVVSQPLADAPFTLSMEGSAAWTPRNYDGEFHGRVSMREALVQSLNIPTVRLALATGMDPVVELATRAGLSGPIPSLPAAALGTSQASPLELAAAYVPLANGGQGVRPRWVSRVEDASGNPLLETEEETRSVLEPGVAYLITDLLRDAVDRGTGQGVRSAGYGGVVAGKTGTTQDARDVWFVGYTPEVVGAVWVGFDEPRPIMTGASGGRLAAPIWGRILARTHSEVQEGGEVWSRPEGVVQRSVDPETGRVLGDGCPSPSNGTVEELFLLEVLPASVCPERQGVRERIGGFFRRLIGRSEEESSTQDEEGPPEALDSGSSLEELLGAPPIPVESGLREEDGTG
jgi:penicillin-binding protein 1A